MTQAERIARLTDSEPPALTICAWCPDFDRTIASPRGTSHGICPACARKLEQPTAA